ncbi:hypothetical protein ACZ90_03515 [Streptomyces albus subsp. albus]|nr:hypothetical protein ACZ90_03515 [Streptomyces albus subsp. albus]
MSVEARWAARARVGRRGGPARWACAVRTIRLLGRSGRWGGALGHRLSAVAVCWAAAAVAGLCWVRCARLLPRAMRCPGPLGTRTRRVLRGAGRRLGRAAARPGPAVLLALLCRLVRRMPGPAAAIRGHRHVRRRVPVPHLRR